MKKKILSILTTAVMLLTLAMPMTAHAEGEWEYPYADNFGGYPSYTFEEFLVLPEDTVCARSETVADIYASYKELGEKENADSGSEWNMPSFWLLLTDDMLTEIKDVYSTQGDLEGAQYVCDVMGIPMEMMDVMPGFMDAYVGDTKLELMRLSIDASEYNGVISAEEITAKTVVWLKQYTYVSEVHLEYAVGGLVLPDEAVIIGDINVDGRISVLDIIMLSKYNSQIITLNESQLQAADCNADGTLDSNDLTSLMSYLVGLSESLPCTV